MLLLFLAHLSRRLKGELMVYPCSGVFRRCRCRSPFSNMNISEANRPIAIKFYLKHHWVGKGCMGSWCRSELIQALMHVIITCKYEKDPIKNIRET